MPEAKETEKGTRTQGGQAIARREREGGLAPRWDLAFGSPLEVMHRMSDEMDRWFDRVSRDFGFLSRSRFPRGLLGRQEEHEFWAPRVEAVQKGDRFIVRAELPGLKKDDVRTSR
jgi:HSP20 family protein